MQPTSHAAMSGVGRHRPENERSGAGRRPNEMRATTRSAAFRPQGCLDGQGPQAPKNNEKNSAEGCPITLRDGIVTRRAETRASRDRDLRGSVSAANRARSEKPDAPNDHFEMTSTVSSLSSSSSSTKSAPVNEETFDDCPCALASALLFANSTAFAPLGWQSFL
jgi:hypothetical protein